MAAVMNLQTMIDHIVEFLLEVEGDERRRQDFWAWCRSYLHLECEQRRRELQDIQDAVADWETRREEHWMLVREAWLEWQRLVKEHANQGFNVRLERRTGKLS